MTNSRVKKAIDETIGTKPLLNEAFVQKVMNGKKKRKKRVPFFQPALVVVLMLLIGAVLYFTPQDKNQAVEIESQYLTKESERLLAQFYGAIAHQDEQAFADLTKVNSEDAFFRYSVFDWSKPLHVLRTIEEGGKVHVYTKLPRSDGSKLIDLVTINTATEQIEFDALRAMKYYDEEIALPSELQLEYKVAPDVAVVKNLEFGFDYAQSQIRNGHTLYRIPTNEGSWYVLHTPSGEWLDLNIVSENTIHFVTGNERQFYFIDSATTQTTYVYRNDAGIYQLVTGFLEARGVTDYATEFHEQPILLLSGTEPKVVTIEQGQLMYADVFEHAELKNEPAFYSTEAGGTSFLVKYTEDLQQISNYYEFTAKDKLMNYQDFNTLEAKPEHLQDMVLQNRYNDRIKYIFANDTLHYRSDTRFYRERPTAENQKPDSGELVEKTYTNIKIETKNNQYFITADDGFSWTLTRTAPRILQDEKGIEYTVPIVFEDLQSPNANLLEGKIQSLMIQEAQGFNIKSYQLKGNFDKINELFMKASANTGIIDMVDAQWHVEVEYVNGQKQKLLLWLGEEGQTSSMMKTDRFNTHHTLYTIPDELAQQFRDLIQTSE